MAKGAYSLATRAHPLVTASHVPHAGHADDHRSFGKVFKARNEQTNVYAAVKIVPAEQDTGEVSREIELLKGCTSANIVQYLGSLTREGELWIIMEFCGGSSLADVMEARGRCLTEAQIAATMAGTLDGLSYLQLARALTP